MTSASNRSDLLYLRSLAHAAPQLSAEHEAQLWYQLRRGQRSAAELLARASQRHVLILAMKYQRYGVPVGELVAEGNWGLVEALAKFEPERGVRFVTYANHWMRARMLGYVVRCRSLVGGSDGAMRRQTFFKLRRERARAFARYGEGDAASAEMARRLNVSPARLEQLLQRVDARDVPLDARDQADDESELLAQLPGDSDPEQLLLLQRRTARLQSSLSEALAQLDPREQQIIELRAMASRDEQLSLAELARRMGVSRERARQLEARALGKLRRALTERDQALASDLF